MYNMTYAQIFCIFTGARPKRPPKSAVTGAKKAWRTLFFGDWWNGGMGRNNTGQQKKMVLQQEYEARNMI